MTTRSDRMREPTAISGARGPRRVAPSRGWQPDTATSTWLRTRTRVQHGCVEVQLSPDRLCCVDDLTHALRGWLAVWSVVQVAVSTQRACEQARDELRIPTLQAVAWLEQDLRDLGAAGLEPALGGGPARLHRLAELLAEPASSWGVAYVLRGSRLGGTVIAPRVSATLALTNGCGTGFFTSCGTDPGREWVAFRRRLDGWSISPAELDSAVEAARWTFEWVGDVVAAELRPTATVPA